MGLKLKFGYDFIHELILHVLISIFLSDIHCRNRHTVHFCQCRFYGNTACWPLLTCWANLIQSRITRKRVAQSSRSLYHNYSWIPSLSPEYKSGTTYAFYDALNVDQSKDIFLKSQTFVIFLIISLIRWNFFALKRYFAMSCLFHITSIFLQMQYKRS